MGINHEPEEDEDIPAPFPPATSKEVVFRKGQYDQVDRHVLTVKTFVCVFEEVKSCFSIEKKNTKKLNSLYSLYHDDTCCMECPFLIHVHVVNY